MDKKLKMMQANHEYEKMKKISTLELTVLIKSTILLADIDKEC